MITDSLESRYFIQLSYRGTQYHGWQVQPNAPSIQQVLNEKLTVLLGHEVETVGAGRTDTGVHAKCFFAHFDGQEMKPEFVKDLVHRMNAILPKDISVYDVIKVRPDAHARFSALSRTYEYHIHILKDPFLEGLSLYYYRKPDIDIMNTACRLIRGEKDFKSFSKCHTDTKTTICKVYQAEWEQDGPIIKFTIRADRFLRNMVRSIVGTMLDVGTQKTSLSELEWIIQSCNRQKAGQSVPAHGLYLTAIEYPDNIFF